MNIKATVIGGDRKLSPTRMGEREAKPDAATAPTAPTATTPAAIVPTALPGATPPTPPAAIKASTLPGTIRKPLAAACEELANRFPEATGSELERLQAVLNGVAPESWDSAAWLSFGEAAQEAVADAVKRRLELAGADAVRALPHHLSRMQELLSDVLEALGGGFLRRSARQVWTRLQPEIRQLEDLLRAGSKTMLKTLKALAALHDTSIRAQQQLAAHSRAAQYLQELLEADAASLLLMRHTALQASELLLQEHLLALRQDEAYLRELIGMVQDGVLVKLPAVSAQLLKLPERPNETERYLAVDKVNELIQFLQRKQEWLCK